MDPPFIPIAWIGLDGYRQGLEEAGLTYDPSMVLVGNYSRKSGYKQAEAVAWLIRARPTMRLSQLMTVWRSGFCKV